MVTLSEENYELKGGRNSQKSKEGIFFCEKVTK